MSNKSKLDSCHDGHRYRQEFVPRRGLDHPSVGQGRWRREVSCRRDVAPIDLGSMRSVQPLRRAAEARFRL
jgi:hypothetical protein